MKTAIAAVLVSFALSTIAVARIGETENEVATRYGKTFGDIPTAAFGKMRGFIWGSYVVGVAIADGKSTMEMFAKPDESDMTASEIKTLLSSNGTEEWKAEITGKPNWRRWRQESSGLVALYDAGRHFLYINSKQFYEDQAKKMESAEPLKKEPSP